MGKILIAAIVVFSVLFVLSGRMKIRLPADSELLQELQYEPVQQEGVPAPFVVEKKGSEFTVIPKYNYEIRGMVVTLHKSKSISDNAHEMWKDFLNVEDICVLWGGNLKQSLYGKVHFTSGDWTCFFQTKDFDVYRAFDLSKISNNHILSNDPAIEKAVLAADIGDQIYMKGYLVDYTKSDGFERRTSITREDKGQGACEILYLTEFRILKKGNIVWASVYSISKYGAIASFVAFIGYIVVYTIVSGRSDIEENDNDARET